MENPYADRRGRGLGTPRPVRAERLGELPTKYGARRSVFTGGVGCTATLPSQKSDRVRCAAPCRREPAGRRATPSGGSPLRGGQRRRRCKADRWATGRPERMENSRSWEVEALCTRSRVLRRPRGQHYFALRKCSKMSTPESEIEH